MGELVFHTGTMDCGKSTLALQLHHTHTTHGRAGLVFTCLDRSGAARITSRVGLSAAAIEVGDDFDFWGFLISELVAARRVDYLVCDEVQFYTTTHVDQLARIVDELQLDVYAFGLLSDFRTNLFPGSRRMVELADRVEMLPIGPPCWCGRKGTHNARTVDGRMVSEGSQVVVGDTVGDGEVRYEVLCRLHHRRQVSAATAKATFSPEPLPFGDDWEQHP